MKKIVMMALVAFALTACQTKDSYVKDFNSFIEKTEAKAEEYSEKDWEKADKTFDELSTTSYAKFKEELSDEEKGEIMRLQATYAGIKMKAGVKNAAKKANDFLNGLSGKDKK